jgi:hypothetical protein
MIRDVQFHPERYLGKLPQDAPYYATAHQKLSWLCRTCWSVMLLTRNAYGQELVDRAVVQGRDPWEKVRAEAPGVEGEEGEAFRKRRGFE